MRQLRLSRGYVLHTSNERIRFGKRGRDLSITIMRGVVIVEAARRRLDPRRNGRGTDGDRLCPERGQSVFARRVNLPNIMEIYSRGTRRRNGFPRARSRDYFATR